MDFSGDSEISINFWSFSVDDCHAEAGTLRLILSELGICVISFEALNLLEM